MGCDQRCIDCAHCVENNQEDAETDFICEVTEEEIENAEREIDSFTDDGEPCEEFEEEG